MPCITFNGYARPGEGTGEAQRIEVSTADFYNPTGEELYGPGSAFGEGEPKPKALLINGSALWCNPCKNEAQQLLPGEYAELHPQGMEFMVIVVESAHIGEPASFSDLDAWVSEFAVTYPAVLDPVNQLGLDTESFPANILVDTRDMTIVEEVKGIPQDSFWAKAEDLVGG
ncbi:MAG: TlpA family protein disulfide reductase [Deltaproteobacteria bacterium]|nr:TlpA family protein disulfide reductase [Deltaproteobacteria bacterium]